MDTENELRCNILSCRAELGVQGKAVVTACSHIFCLPCANTRFSQETICPACDQHLSPDDLGITMLNPSNDYKSSILAGLSPSIVCDIANRAMAFWVYQTSQENAFQKVVLKNAQGRIAGLEKQLAIVHGDLQAAKTKISELERDLEHSGRRFHDVLHDNKQKDSDMLKLRGNLDKMKRKMVVSQATTGVDFGFDAGRAPLSTMQNNLLPTNICPPETYVPVPGKPLVGQFARRVPSERGSFVGGSRPRF